MEQDKSDKKYTDAVAQGHYDIYRGGLSGHYDNVRIYWEDQIRGIRFRPYLKRLVDRKKRAGSKVRIVDLGAGTGEGLRLLTSWLREEPDLRVNQTKVLPYDMIEVYEGCDLCQAMVNHGGSIFADRPNVNFRRADFSRGFPLKAEKPFDIYFCSYGSLSHIDDQNMENLLREIVEHAGDKALVVGEWLGRHSIEWPCYWSQPGSEMLDYSMSWISTSSESEDEPEHFPMRFWLGDEICSLVNQVARETRTKITILDLYDCSIFTGRHVDTNEYNEWVTHIRAAVNRLHESNVRTDLETLIAEVNPVPGHDELNRYFEQLRSSWNQLVTYCRIRLERRCHPVQTRRWQTFHPALQMAIMTLDRVIDNVSWMQMGDPRANIVEPQLGYALRGLEVELGQGKGRGHALIGIFEIHKA